MKKQMERFLFFEIRDVAHFRRTLKAYVPRITSAATLIPPPQFQPLTFINVAFSQTGLETLNVTDVIGDTLFQQGQASQASVLGDPGTTNWVPQFVGTNVHGVFLVASDSKAAVYAEIAHLEHVLGHSIKKLYTLDGNIRPGNQEGHEHFGYKDVRHAAH